jgi:hypothetical protein
MTTERDESFEALIAAVLQGDPDAANALHRFMSRHGTDPGSVRRRAEAELAATHDELEDLIRQLREGNGEHGDADVLLETRAGWWRLLRIARQLGTSGEGRERFPAPVISRP